MAGQLEQQWWFCEEKGARIPSQTPQYWPTARQDRREARLRQAQSLVDVDVAVVPGLHFQQDPLALLKSIGELIRLLLASSRLFAAWRQTEAAVEVLDLLKEAWVRRVVWQ